MILISFLVTLNRNILGLESAAEAHAQHVSDDHGAAHVGDAAGARLPGRHVGDVGEAGHGEDHVAAGEVLEALKF